MKVHKSPLAVCALAAVLAGCGGSDKKAATAATTPEPTPTVNVIIPGAPGEPSRTVTATPTPVNGGSVAADVEFMRGMIHHHDQAITMTKWVPDRTASTSIRLMAKRMEVSQTDEIDFMKKWLEKRGEKPAAEHGAHDMMMPGMLNEEQLTALENAKGKAFDKLFLAYMTQHHEGALEMVRDLFNAGGGAESEIGQFAMHVDSDQQIEIQRMAELAQKL